MHALALFMIVAVTTFEFLSQGDRWGRWALLPGSFAYMGEILGAIAAIAVVFAGARDRFQFVRPAYWILFGALVLNIVAGALVNHVDAGPVFAGIRNYLRALPWFLVPAVFAFTSKQIRAQLRVVLGVAVIQLPLSAQQSMTTIAKGRGTGDWTFGTLMASPILTIFLVCCMGVASAFLVRKRLSWPQFAVVFLVLLIPVTINETKVTIVLLPLALLIAVLTASRPDQRLRYAAVGLGLVLVSAAIFVPVYDKLIQNKEYAVTLDEFFTDQETVERYMSTTDDIGVGDRRAGRLDSIVVPLRRLSRDPLHLLFGYGIGNASHSALGAGFVGSHNRLFAPFLETAFSRLVLELGLFGVAGVFALMWFIFRDATVVARKSDGLIGTVAAGWTGAVAVISICIMYTDVIMATSISYLFWYFSGLVAAERMRLVMQSKAVVARASNG